MHYDNVFNNDKLISQMYCYEHYTTRNSNALCEKSNAGSNNKLLQVVYNDTIYYEKLLVLTKPFTVNLFWYTMKKSFNVM